MKVNWRTETLHLPERELTISVVVDVDVHVHAEFSELGDEFNDDDRVQEWTHAWLFPYLEEHGARDKAVIWTTNVPDSEPVIIANRCSVAFAAAERYDEGYDRLQ